MAAPKEPIDLTKLSPEDRIAYQKYGKVPLKRGIHAERKYFDSGDYEMSKQAGSGQPTGVGIPDPKNIPHSAPLMRGHMRKPSTDARPSNLHSTVAAADAPEASASQPAE